MGAAQQGKRRRMNNAAEDLWTTNRDNTWRGGMKHPNMANIIQKHTNTHARNSTLTLQKQTGTHLPLSLPPNSSWVEQYKTQNDFEIEQK